jgi:hypothetical protein
MPKSKKAVKARKGDLVLIHLVVLEPAQRAENLPEVTRIVPYEGWIKGFLLEDEAEIGETVRIKSLIGRDLSGKLTEINPVYDHGFGEPQPELNAIGPEAWKELQGREKR